MMPLIILEFNKVNLKKEILQYLLSSSCFIAKYYLGCHFENYTMSWYVIILLVL